MSLLVGHQFRHSLGRDARDEESGVHAPVHAAVKQTHHIQAGQGEGRSIGSPHLDVVDDISPDFQQPLHIDFMWWGDHAPHFLT